MIDHYTEVEGDTRRRRKDRERGKGYVKMENEK